MIVVRFSPSAELDSAEGVYIFIAKKLMAKRHSQLSTLNSQLSTLNSQLFRFLPFRFVFAVGDGLQGEIV